MIAGRSFCVDQGGETVTMGQRHFDPRTGFSRMCIALRRRPALGLWILALSLPTAQAAPIEFHYGGTITSAGAGTNVAVGSRFDGTFTYDPQANLTPMVYENGRTYTYGQSVGAATTPVDSSAMSLTIGGSSAFSKSGGLAVGLYEVGGNDPYNPNPVTNLTFNSYNSTTKVDLEVLLSLIHI